MNIPHNFWGYINILMHMYKNIKLNSFATKSQKHGIFIPYILNRGKYRPENGENWFLGGQNLGVVCGL